MKGITPYVGTDVENIFSVLGYPDTQKRFRDKIIYTWHNDSMSYMPDFQYNPYGISSYGGYYIPGNCKLQIITNSSNLIIDANVQGNNAGCDLFLNQLTQK